MAASRLYTGPFQPTLEAAFTHEVARLHAPDPLAPITVLTPTRILGRHLARLLARDGALGVRLETLPDLAARLAWRRLGEAGKRRMPTVAELLLLGRALGAVRGTGTFGALAPSRSLLRRLRTTITDLRRAGVTPAHMRAAGEPRLRDLGDLLEAFRGEAERLGFYDGTDLLRAAAEAARETPLAEPVLIYGFWEWNPAEEDLLATLAGGEAAAFVPRIAGEGAIAAEAAVEWFRGHGFADEPPRDVAPTATQRVALRLFGGATAESAVDGRDPGPGTRGQEGGRTGSDALDVRDPGPGTRDPKGEAQDSGALGSSRAAVEILSCPTEASEAREAARALLAHVERTGTSFGRCAILCRSLEPYRLAIRDAAAEAGVPLFWAEGETMLDRPAARSLVLLLAMRRANYGRAEVAEFLTYAPLSKRLLDLGSPAEWDALSIEAGIVGGARDWLERAAHLARRLAARARHVAARDPERGEAAAQRAEAAARFRRAAGIVIRAADEIPLDAPLGEMARQAARAYDALVASSQDANVVRGIVEDVGGVPVQDPVDLDTFAAIVEDALASGAPEIRQFRAGRVYVGGLEVALGLPFEAAVVLGVAERAFPAPPREDPIVPDEAREALMRGGAGRMVLSRDRPLEDRLAFVLACGSAREALAITYPRADAATGQVRVASFYALELAGAVTGGRVSYDGLERHPCHRRVPASPLAPTPLPLSRTEAVLANLGEAAGALRDPPFRRGLLMVRSREGRAFTEYDGMIGPAGAGGAAVSAAQIETYATCPMSYLFGRVLRLEPVEEPRDDLTVAPMDAGSLVHEILERAYRRLAAGGALPVTEERIGEAAAAVREEAGAAFEAFERSGATGHPALWEIAKAGMRTTALAALEADLARGDGGVPAEFEVRFGREAPVEIEVAGRRAAIAGRIDRIDVRGRAARVIDYKTGKVVAEREGLLLGGTTVQLPLYLLAAERLLQAAHPGARVEEAAYLYLRRGLGAKTVAFDRAALEARAADLAAVLDAFAEGVRGGLFVQRPGEGEANCAYCPFTPCCGEGRERRFERKRADPVARAFVALEEIE